MQVHVHWLNLVRKQIKSNQILNPKPKGYKGKNYFSKHLVSYLYEH